MNPDLDKLHDYPFTRLNRLLASVGPPGSASPGFAERPISLAIGEPQHPPPPAVLETLTRHLSQINRYPSTAGIEALREAIVDWARQRYALPAGSLAAANVLPVQGSREALFAIAQVLVDNSAADPLVLLPSPFYQIYEGAALMAGARPVYLPALAGQGFLPDLDAIDDATWQGCQLLYVCNPGNPTGAVIPADYYARLLALADRHDFVIASDECYSEIYLPEGPAPTGLLGVCAQQGRDDFARCIVFNSLSKRSNLPGMRSGFVAGDAALIARFLQYRTYHGSAMPLYHQQASIAAWRDETHVRENRALYQQKFAAVQPLLQPVVDFAMPAAGFCLWLPTPIDDQQFAKLLYERYAVTVLPGSYLARDLPGQTNPGEGYVRIALVAELDDCIEAVQRLVACYRGVI